MLEIGILLALLGRRRFQREISLRGAFRWHPRNFKHRSNHRRSDTRSEQSSHCHYVERLDCYHQRCAVGAPSRYLVNDSFALSAFRCISRLLEKIQHLGAGVKLSSLLICLGGLLAATTLSWSQLWDRRSVKELFRDARVGKLHSSAYAKVAAPVSFALIVSGTYLAFTWR